MPNYRWVPGVAWLLFCCLIGDLRADAGVRSGFGSPYIVDVWETEDGLPQNSVIAITQTRDGYLWFGTLNGLVRFDGIRFTVFDETNTRGLNSSRIVSLFEDSRGDFWIGTETAGVVLVKDGELKGVDIGRGSREGRLASICEDSTGAVWLYTADGQLSRYHEGRGDIWNAGTERFSVYRGVIADSTGALWVGMDWTQVGIIPTVPTGPTKLPVSQVLPVRKLDFLLASGSGGYWRLADGRVQKWSGNRMERDLGPYPWEAAVPVAAACEDGEGNLVVGTLGNGIFWFDTKGLATTLSTNQGLSHSYVLSLLMDREGSLWVGTDGGGLNRVKRQTFDVLEASRGLVVQSVDESGPGGLWTGYIENGVGFWSDGAMRWFGPDQGLSSQYARAVFVDRDESIWVSTLGAGLFRFQNNRFRQVAGAEAMAIHQDRDGRMWFGTPAGLVSWDGREWKTYTTSDGLSADVVQAIADDTDGNLWVGTVGGGLNRLRDGRFTAYRKGTEGLPSDDISSLYVDAEGVLWVGTFGSGLARLHGGKWTRYSTKEGLVSNSIGYMVEDGQGYFWIGSNAGLMRVPKKALDDVARGASNSIPCRVYGKADGLPTRECTMGSQPGACVARDGRLWFPTIKGLVSVNPAVLSHNPHAPPVVIESVLVEGREQHTNRLHAPWPEFVTVPAGKERLEIRFTSLNLAAPDRARFRYRLEGHETDWAEVVDGRVARYSKLPPGDYRFRVLASNEDGVWNEIGASVAVTVLPPFWRTWWFLTVTGILLLGAIVSFVHYYSTQRLQRQLERLRQQEVLEAERSRIARDLHDQLGANLTQVALLGELVESDKDAPGEVEAHARQISQTARETTLALDEIVWAANPSNDTLDGLVTYACKHAQEYLAVAGVRYRQDIPTRLPDATIPPEVRHNVFLAFKEAVTNVVKHSQATEVRVRLGVDRGRFTLEVEDNGRGIGGLDEGRAATRNGLRNMRRRMEDVGGSFAITAAPEAGTVVRLSAPIEAAGTRP